MWVQVAKASIWLCTESVWVLQDSLALCCSPARFGLVLVKPLVTPVPCSPKECWREVCTTVQMYRACSLLLSRGKAGKAVQKDHCCSAFDLPLYKPSLDRALEIFLYSLTHAGACSRPCKENGCPWAGWGTWQGSVIGSTIREQPRDVTMEGVQWNDLVVTNSFAMDNPPPPPSPHPATFFSLAGSQKLFL